MAREELAEDTGLSPETPHEEGVPVRHESRGEERVWRQSFDRRILSHGVWVSCQALERHDSAPRFR